MGALDSYAGGQQTLFSGVTRTKEKLTFQLSDHRPLWLQVRVDAQGFELDQILNRQSTWISPPSQNL